MSRQGAIEQESCRINDVCTFAVPSLGFDGRGDVLPVYLGDDRTDEDAFKVDFIFISSFKVNSGVLILLVQTNINLVSIRCWERVVMV
jgi:hypothetical protein